MKLIDHEIINAQIKLFQKVKQEKMTRIT